MPIFVVHEHYTRRLHYDFRLERKGVLASWAVPKGPSMNPKDKRLAILVDDHPIEYGDFEGTIEEGQYGAGKVIIWDKGLYDHIDGGLSEGRIKFNLNGEKLKGLFVLIKLRGQKNEWLLIKEKDAFSDSSFEMKPALEN